MQPFLGIRWHGDGTAVTTFSQPASVRRHFFLNVLVQTLHDIIAGSREGLAMQDRYEKLSRLSDWELARRGLTRADTRRLVVHGDPHDKGGGWA
jgi:hypothetical protein